jgi:hypothetical protein
MSQILTEAEVLSWKQDGFLVRQEFADETTLASMRVAESETLDAQFAGDRMLGGVTCQVMTPAVCHPCSTTTP